MQLHLVLTPASQNLKCLPDSTTQAISTKSVSLQQAMIASCSFCSPCIPPKFMYVGHNLITWINFESLIIVHGEIWE